MICVCGGHSVPMVCVCVCIFCDINVFICCNSHQPDLRIIMDLIQRRAQRAFGGIYTANPGVRNLSPRRWLDLGGPNLQGVLGACPRLSSRKNFFDRSTFKKLTFAEPRMLKLGWWGGQITTRCMFLFKKPN